MNYKNYLNIFFSIIVIFLLIFLIHSSLIDKFIWKGEYLFGDLKAPINWLKCNYLGFDLYKESIKNCPNFDGTSFTYGHIFLIIPFNNILEIFYINYLPYLIIITFVFSVILIINPKTYGRNYSKCLGSQLQPCIGADGNVYVCTNHRGHKNYAYGNIFEKSFKEVWKDLKSRKKIL